MFSQIEMRFFVYLLDIGRELIGQHFVYLVLAAVGHGLFVVPALEFHHGKRFFKREHLLLDRRPAVLEKRLAICVGRAALGHPREKLLYIAYLKPRLLQALDNAQRLKLIVAEKADAAAPLKPGDDSVYVKLK